MSTCKLTQNIDAWEKILSKDTDSEFILDGVRNGFKVVDNTDVVQNVYCKNYSSVLEESVRPLAESQIKHEIESRNYVVVDRKPNIVSSLGAIVKDSGKVRLIHDCSKPDNFSVNSYANTSHFKYQTVDDVVKKLPAGGYMAKLDLSSAYRSVPIHPSCYEFMGLSWKFDGDCEPTYLIDTRFAFGLAKAPMLFQRIGNSIVRYMRTLGFMVVCYLDDYLVISDSEHHCKQGHDLLLETLEKLGFEINFKKVEYPSQKMVFLGIEIDSVQCSLSLPDNKLHEMKIELAKWQTKTKATKLELQQLIGRLNWGAKVIKGGRTFLRRLIDLMCSLKRKHHHTRINSSAKADIQWWIDYISIFNGTTHFIKEVVPSRIFTTDACTHGGAGAFNSDWFYANWETDYPEIANLHINFKELFAVFLASLRWAKSWTNKHVIVYSDNTYTVFMINKGTSKNNLAMDWLRQLFWLSACYNFQLTARHLRGKDNLISDKLSRLHDVKIDDCIKFLCEYKLDTKLSHHMSNATMNYCFFRNSVATSNTRVYELQESSICLFD